MKKELLINYLNNLTIPDLKSIAQKENIPLSDEESKIIIYYLKHRYNDILTNPDIIFNEIKTKITPYLYESLTKLYQNYKFIIDKIK